jgi:hypothetical protein
LASRFGWQAGRNAEIPGGIPRNRPRSAKIRGSRVIGARINASVAKKFDKLNFHDDVLTFVRMYPPTSRTNNLTRIEFGFLDDATHKKKTLLFHQCANIRFIMDFDVLADQCVFGTEGSSAQVDILRMRKFVQSQRSHWRVEYMPPMPKDKPIRKKLRSIRSYVLFKVAFFGGTAEVLARNFELKVG